MARKPQNVANESDQDTDDPGSRLGWALAQLGLRQAEVARRTSAPASYVNDVIHGRRSLTEAFAGTLQNEFGVDKIWLRHGEGQMFRRLPSPPGLEGSGHMTPLPLLDRVCQGNPLDSDAWAGSIHPVPRGQSRPTTPNVHRYVLRISGQGSTGAIRDGDLILVETVAIPSSLKLDGCWCVVVTDDFTRILKCRKSTRLCGAVWGWCVGTVWRPFSTPH